MDKGVKDALKTLLESQSLASPKRKELLPLVINILKELNVPENNYSSEKQILAFLSNTKTKLRRESQRAT